MSQTSVAIFLWISNNIRLHELRTILAPADDSVLRGRKLPVVRRPRPRYARLMRGGFDQRWRFEDRSGEFFVLTGWGHAAPEERAAALDSHSARWILEHSWRSWWRDEGRSDLVAINTLLNYDEFNVRNVTTQELARRVFDAVERGYLLVLREYGTRHSIGRHDAVTAVLRQVMGDRRELSFEGHGYRVVDLSNGVRGTPAQEWRLLEHAEAVAIIARMADQVPRTGQERPQWAALLTLIERDERSPRIGLLRRRRGGVAPQPEPPVERRATARQPKRTCPGSRFRSKTTPAIPIREKSESVFRTALRWTPRLTIRGFCGSTPSCPAPALSLWWRFLSA